MSVVGVIASLSTSDADGGYVVSRTANGGYDGATGDAVDGATTTIVIDAVVTTASSRTLLERIEGRHTEETISIITETELLVGDRQFQPDIVTFLGEQYEVLRIDGPFHLGGGTHFEAYAARIEAP